jgi:hypothetical protein
MDLTAEIQNFNKVKDIILSKLVQENLLDQSDADEFSDRCQVLCYKGKWFSKWFDKNIKAEDPNADKESYYIRIVEMKEKEDEVDRLLRRTTGNYDE